VIGALTVQSTEQEAFNEDTITVFQTMADQIAIALDNAQLIERTQAALESERRAYGELSQQAWTELLSTQPDLGILVSRTHEVKNLENEWTPEMIEASQRGEVVRSDNRTLAVPIVLRDQVLGVVRLRKNEGEPDWTNTEIDFMNTLVDQFENALESARLFSNTQRRAAFERITRETATRMRETLEIEAVLRSATTELRKSLNLGEVEIRFGSNPVKSGD
jgi:GAF domain-containing protein